MTKRKTSIIDFYEINDNNDQVTLKYNLDFGQTADTSIRINQQKIPNGDLESFAGSFEVKLPTNNEILNKELILTSVAYDISDKTNKISLSISLEGGVKDQKWNLGPFDVEEGDTMLITADIGFYKKNK